VERVDIFCSVLKRVSACCSKLQCVAVCRSVMGKLWCVKLRFVGFSCAWSVSTCIAAFCSVLQRVAVCSVSRGM